MMHVRHAPLLSCWPLTGKVYVLVEVFECEQSSTRGLRPFGTELNGKGGTILARGSFLGALTLGPVAEEK